LTIVDKVSSLLKNQLKNESKAFDKIMSSESCADYLDVEIQWIRERCRKNKIPFYKVGKLIKFKKSKIDEWLEKQKIPEI
jgi:excisionase family DNA binding protein